jgi:hypothetical protein
MLPAVVPVGGSGKREFGSAAHLGARTVIAELLAPLQPVVNPRATELSAKELDLSLPDPPSDCGRRDLLIAGELADRQPR